MRSAGNVTAASTGKSRGSCPARGKGFRLEVLGNREVGSVRARRDARRREPFRGLLSDVSRRYRALRPGMRIEQGRFGTGVVKSAEGNGENAKAAADFRNTGTKQLLSRFARFKIMRTK